MTSADIDDVALRQAVPRHLPQPGAGRHHADPPRYGHSRATAAARPDYNSQRQAAGSTAGLLVLWAGPVVVYVLLLARLW